MKEATYEFKLKYLLSKSSSLDAALSVTLSVNQMIIGHKKDTLFHTQEAKSLHEFILNNICCSKSQA
jgi:hypothetical protein